MSTWLTPTGCGNEWPEDATNTWDGNENTLTQHELGMFPDYNYLTWSIASTSCDSIRIKEGYGGTGWLAGFSTRTWQAYYDGGWHALETRDIPYSAASGWHEFLIPDGPKNVTVIRFGATKTLANLTYIHVYEVEFGSAESSFARPLVNGDLAGHSGGLIDGGLIPCT